MAQEAERPACDCDLKKHSEESGPCILGMRPNETSYKMEQKKEMTEWVQAVLDAIERDEDVNENEVRVLFEEIQTKLPK
ncbi:hypothetical protein ECANGB1_324 [Enterospora canceri]|uniref:Uncharacterized protein n=1 Tax=Enterospora canceri TaxID=1081671 RepID=A0A1Y1S5M2_9MICR|nr:hypothetical protein ECANGB1_324 [Enterospora canceri]